MNLIWQRVHTKLCIFNHLLYLYRLQFVTINVLLWPQRHINLALRQKTGLAEKFDRMGRFNKQASRRKSTHDADNAQLTINFCITVHQIH